MKRLYPSQLREPFQFDDVRRVLESWEGVEYDRLPREIRLLSWMYDTLIEAAGFCDRKEREVGLLTEFIGDMDRHFRMWPEHLARKQLETMRVHNHTVPPRTDNVGKNRGTKNRSTNGKAVRRNEAARSDQAGSTGKQTRATSYP